MYLANLLTIVELGYYKDLSNIVELVYKRNLPFLHDQYPIELVVFGELLRNEQVKLVSNSDKPFLTLAGKWAPSNNSHFDKFESGSQAKTLAKFLFPNSMTQNRDYRKLLSSLREQLKVV